MERSIVEYFAGQEGYRCGYCNSTDTCYSHGMWAHALTPLDYQILIDRGWRRSGKYCYKPTMSMTCCPLYTIRCEAKKFSLSRSQKKVLKKVYKYLAFGDKEKTEHQKASESNENADQQDMDVSEFPQEVDMQSLKRIKRVKPIKQSDVHIDDSEAPQTDLCSPNAEQNERCDRPSSSSQCSSKSSQSTNPSNEPTSPLKSSNLGNNVPKCRKAKVIRQERKLQKLLKMGVSPEEAAASIKKKTSEPKTIEDFLSEPMPVNPAHKLELRLVPSALENPLFCQTFEESYGVYKKYQMTIHKDPAEKCTTKQYTRFLVNSPFQDINDCPANISRHGSFHQQYWLDNKLIAVGVIDVLPFCVSSVYFYYDPDYSFLSLGTYAALKEIALTRELNTKFPDLQYYYMGYYIHSCIKMRYKGQYAPSFLLCPETYIFQPIEKCMQKLDISKYHRLEEDPNKEDTDGVVNLKEIVILYNKTKMTYLHYRSLNKDSEDENAVREYAKFVGRQCYRRVMLYKDS